MNSSNASTHFSRLATVLALVSLLGCATPTEEWRRATALGTAKAYEDYIRAYPNTSNAAEAKRRIGEMSAWQQALGENTPIGYTRYLAQFSDFPNAAEARRRRAALQEEIAWKEAQSENTAIAYTKYIAQYPGTHRADEARLRRSALQVAAVAAVPPAQSEVASQPATAASPSPPPSGPTTTPRSVLPAEQRGAEAYRDLIVGTADPMSRMQAYGQVTPGAGSETVDRREVPCIMTFTKTDSAAKDIAQRRDAWRRARVPAALSTSHGEILQWMTQTEAAAKEAPTCFLPLLQSSQPQFTFLLVLGGYDEIRKKAASALSEFSIALPPLPRPDRR